ncbi:MAG TPA: hypothetical protein DCE41_33480 [Cytophagales bacterium]|nr:hypothetical protein [Cytophagales bacterium]HAA20153.1 hypothetical protein [Cytophagales bacterium]HAP65087.1 hypothetical protein [Cytophagales bacterium]
MAYHDKSEIVQDDGKGICGFVGMAQLLIDYGKMSLPTFNKEYGTAIAFAAEWLSIQLDHDKKLARETGKKVVATALNQSLKLTGEWVKAEDLTVEKLIEYTKNQFDGIVGFALTPEAICDYLDRRYGLKMMIEMYDPYRDFAAIWQDTKNHLGPGMYGIGSADPKSSKDFWLRHWVYIDQKGELMTWGDEGKKALKALKDKKPSYTHVLVRLYPK